MPPSIDSNPRSLPTGPDARADLARTARRCAVIAWCLWALLAAGDIGLVLRAPDRHRVDLNYRNAAVAFVHGDELYSPGEEGWLYPVQSAIVYLPFSFGPLALGESLWTCTGVGLLAIAIVRLAGACGQPPGRADLFLLLTLLAIAPAASSARNGQMNLPLAALFTLACVDAMSHRWSRTAAWLALALACKPTAVVIVLLMTALHRPLWWRVPIGLAVVAALPFLHPDWPYVAEQYRLGFRKVLETTGPAAREFADLTSLLRLVNAEPGPRVMTLISAAAALATLGLAWLARRQFDHRTSGVLLLALGAAYLMLFNRRTEANTYVILGVPAAVLAAWALRHGARSHRAAALVTACLLLGFSQFALPHYRDYWVRPAVALAMLVWLAGGIALPALRRSIPTAPHPERIPGGG